MNDADRQLVDTLRRDGIAVLPDLLSADEVAAVRAEFDRSCLDAGKGLGDPGVRDGVSGDALLAYPSLAALFWHPRILSVVTAMLEQPHSVLTFMGVLPGSGKQLGIDRDANGALDGDEG